jgi:hypothetical protein
VGGWENERVCKKKKKALRKGNEKAVRGREVLSSLLLRETALQEFQLLLPLVSSTGWLSSRNEF